jgi:hypothetical protein
MNAKQIEQEFEKIAEEAISKAEHVDCSFARFIDGLKDIETTIRDRREMAQHEQDRREEDE